MGAASTQVEVREFRDGFFPYEGGATKEYFQDLRSRCAPDPILTHRRRSWHQDHRLKYDGDLEPPNVFVPVSEQVRLGSPRSIMAAWPTKDDPPSPALMTRTSAHESERRR